MCSMIVTIYDSPLFVRQAAGSFHTITLRHWSHSFLFYLSTLSQSTFRSISLLSLAVGATEWDNLLQDINTLLGFEIIWEIF